MGHGIYPKNPDPQTHRVLRARTPAMEGPTPAMESPRILRVYYKCRSSQGWLKRGQWGGSPNWQSHGSCLGVLMLVFGSGHVPFSQVLPGPLGGLRKKFGSGPSTSYKVFETFFLEKSGSTSGPGASYFSIYENRKHPQATKKTSTSAIEVCNLILFSQSRPPFGFSSSGHDVIR